MEPTNETIEQQQGMTEAEAWMLAAIVESDGYTHVHAVERDERGGWYVKAHEYGDVEPVFYSPRDYVAYSQRHRRNWAEGAGPDISPCTCARCA